MKKLLTIALLLALIYVTSFVLRDEIYRTINGAVVFLSGSNEIKEFAINHYNALHATEPIALDTPVTIHYEYIDSDKIKDILAIYSSEQTCGEGGCMTSIFLASGEKYEAIPFELGVNTYEILPEITNNMHDMRVNKVKLVWNGTSYVIQD